MLQWRKQRGDYFSPKSIFIPKSCEYLPWTAAPGNEGLRDCITMQVVFLALSSAFEIISLYTLLFRLIFILQHSLTLKYGARATGELDLKNRFYEQLVSLTDILLDGRRSHVNSTRGEPKFEALQHQYENSRLSLITPFCKINNFFF